VPHYRLGKAGFSNKCSLNVPICSSGKWGFALGSHS
jgi:hypothetical protein